jgi:two-component system phosphate regulon sensor histidine kinase PhoR
MAKKCVTRKLKCISFVFMKRKIILLTVGCIITVAALAAIQGYFIYNTYKLKEKEVKDEIHKQLLELEDTSVFDTINSNWMAKTGSFSKDYIAKKVKKVDYVKFISKNSDTLSQAIFKLLKERKITDKYKARYTNYITSVVVEGDGGRDTLFRGKLFLFGDSIKGKNKIMSSQGKWQSRSSERKEDDIFETDTIRDYKFEVKTETYYSIDNWEKLVLGRMAGLFVFSILLLAFVVILFYLSLRNLITQKKISDIKTDFVDNITHEFKTPIATMDIAIKTFERNDISKEQVESSVAIIKRQNLRLQSLFNQVKDASLSSSAIQINTSVICTAKDVAEIISDFKVAHPGISISLNAPNYIVLYIESSHLYTLLVNLLDNSVKFGANVVDVSVADHETNTILSVQDNGPGIPVKEQKAIFDKFYRIQKGNVHSTKGLGLGLFYVSQIVNTYNGTITVENLKGETGALFTLSIPKL